jgi:hypothetical protein
MTPRPAISVTPRYARTVVTFQVKHRRGRVKGTARQLEFSDITTRLAL